MTREQGMPTAEDVRTEIKAWLEENWDPDITVGEWWQRLGLSGWAAPILPTNAYGKGLGRNDAVRVQTEIGSFGAVGAPAGQGSQATDPDCSSSSPASSTLFDPDMFSSRTYPVSSLRTAVGTSESCLERWPTSGTAWPGGLSTHVSSECRSDDAGCSSLERSLSEILEPPLSVPDKYSLSARAAAGILRRAEKRGRTLPGHLAAALESVAGLRTPSA